jgi:hypothetical protein
MKKVWGNRYTKSMRNYEEHCDGKRKDNFLPTNKRYLTQICNGLILQCKTKVVVSGAP